MLSYSTGTNILRPYRHISNDKILLPLFENKEKDALSLNPIMKAVVATWLHSISARRKLPSGLKVKVKVKLSLCLTKHHAMKTYWGS
jgi:hypothetical protein